VSTIYFKLLKQQGSGRESPSRRIRKKKGISLSFELDSGRQTVEHQINDSHKRYFERSVRIDHTLSHTARHSHEIGPGIGIDGTDQPTYH